MPAEGLALDGSLREEFLGAVITLSPEGEILSWDPSAEELCGYAVADVSRRSFFELIVHAERTEEARGQLRIAVERGSAAFECACRRKDGSIVFLSVALKRISPTPGGRFVAANLRNTSDLTYLRQSRQLDAKFHDLLEAAPDAMLMVNQEGRIVLLNTQTERLFGYKREEILGQAMEMLVPERFRDAHPARRVGYFAGTGIELYGQRKDGSEFPVEINLSPFETEEGTLVSSAIRDLTERRRLEDLRRKGLQEASRLKSEFLANMSHELRTPLNAIIGFAELLSDGKAGPVEADQHEYLGDILTSAHHLLQLINDVLDLSKVEAGKIDFYPEPVDLGTVVREARDLLRSLAAAKRIAVAVEVDANTGEAVLDPAKLKQVLYNYLSNALKFTPEGGRVTIRTGPEGDDAFRLEVVDNGIGIRPQDLERLFVEFQQLDAGKAKRYPGTGLGLALTKRIVEAQGGRVGVTSTPGEGSVFFAVLPRRTQAEPPAPAAEPPSPEFAPGAPAVLVVEDDPQDRAWLVRVLTAAGYAVATATTGAAALALCRERSFDAITLDMLLPDTNGLSLLRLIHAEGMNRDVPVIVVSMAAENVATGFSVHDVFTKPVEAWDLLVSLKRAGAVPGTDLRRQTDLARMIVVKAEGGSQALLDELRQLAPAPRPPEEEPPG